MDTQGKECFGLGVDEPFLGKLHQCRWGLDLALVMVVQEGKQVEDERQMPPVTVAVWEK